MKLVGNLKKQVELTGSIEEAKKVIENAGMELTDDELDKVAGGQGRVKVSFCQCASPDFGDDGKLNYCRKCGGVKRIGRQKVLGR